MTYAPRLLIIRGNSGSGKSTVARIMRDSLRPRAALIEQDYLRRTVLQERETEGNDNIALIEQTVRFALTRGYDVVLEGYLTYRTVPADAHATDG